MLVAAILFLWLRPRGIRCAQLASSVADRPHRRAACSLLGSSGPTSSASTASMRSPRSASAFAGGRPDFLPLGQALFFGLAAYLSGLALIAFTDASALSPCCLPLAAIASGLLAYAIGVLVFRRRGESGPYFSMITLALSLLAFQIATSWNSVTGGFNGLKGIPGLPGLDDYLRRLLRLGRDLARRARRSPAGSTARRSACCGGAGAERAPRCQLFGFDTNQLKAVAFGVSGLMAGIGGAIYAPQQGLVTPQAVGFASRPNS